MKTNWITAALVALVTTSSLAADLTPIAGSTPVYTPPPPPPMWTGFYAGLNAGYGWGTTTSAATAAAPLLDGIALEANALDPRRQLAGTGLIPGMTALANSGFASINQNGFIGGGQIGYNYQWGANVVAGLEADMQGTTIQGGGGYTGASQDSIAWKDPIFPGLAPCSLNGCLFNRTALGFGRISAGVDWMGTVRGRLGYLVTPTMLVYGTGGLAYGGAHASASHTAFTIGALSGANDAQFPVPFPYSRLNGAYFIPLLPGAAHYSDNRVGWTAGGGVEWMFMPNWSVKAEALYYDLGSAAVYSGPVTLVSPFTIRLGGISATTGQLFAANAPVSHVKFDGVIARAGVNYHFNWGPAGRVLASF